MEIIKGLQRMAQEDPNGFSADVLKVINHQNAEIGRLTKALIEQRLKYKATQEELTQWKGEANRWQTMFCQEIDGREEIKTEAYKEFAEKIKDMAFPLLPHDTARDGFVLHLKQLLKEMGGEE